MGGAYFFLPSFQPFMDSNRIPRKDGTENGSSWREPVRKPQDSDSDDDCVIVESRKERLPSQSSKPVPKPCAQEKSPQLVDDIVLHKEISTLANDSSLMPLVKPGSGKDAIQQTALNPNATSFVPNDAYSCTNGKNLVVQRASSSELDSSASAEKKLVAQRASTSEPDTSPKVGKHGKGTLPETSKEKSEKSSTMADTGQLCPTTGMFIKADGNKMVPAAEVEKDKFQSLKPTPVPLPSISHSTTSDGPSVKDPPRTGTVVSQGAGLMLVGSGDTLASKLTKRVALAQQLRDKKV
jgi:hypothetical protein